MYGRPELNDPMVQALTMRKVAVNKKGEQSMETDWACTYLSSIYYILK